MKFSLKKAKKITSLVLAFVMMLGLVEGITLSAFATVAKAATLADTEAGGTVATVGNATIVASQKLTMSPYAEGAGKTANGKEYTTALKSSSANNGKIGSSTARVFGYATATADTKIKLFVVVGSGKTAYLFESDSQLTVPTVTDKGNECIFDASTAKLTLAEGVNEIALTVEAGKYYYLVGVGTNLELLDVLEDTGSSTGGSEGTGEGTGGGTGEGTGEGTGGGEESKADMEAINAFVSRLYSVVFGREASEEELVSWATVLANGESNGIDASYGFIFSDEFKADDTITNEKFVQILYKTFMDREGDSDGLAAWTTQLNNGVTREKVFEGFVYSQEYIDICKATGIEVGTVEQFEPLTEALALYRNQNADITAFVARCYTTALGRDFDEAGLEAWCRVIIEEEDTPKKVAADGFFFSDEFLKKSKEMSDTEYLQILYRTFLDREADEAGLNAWLSQIEKGEEDRTSLLDGFADSIEFKRMLEEFGLPTEDNGPKVKESSVTYDFTNNANKAKPEVNGILEGTNTETSGILYADAGSSSGCSFDSNQLRFRNGVILYLPIKEDTTKIKYAYVGSGNNAGRPTYLGSVDSGYQVEYAYSAELTIDDITDLIVEKDGQKYFPIISGGDVKIKSITLTEYNPINSVPVSGNVAGAAANGIKEIKFKNLTNTAAPVIKAAIDADGNYSTVLRRVNGNAEYVASITATGYKIDDTNGANKFTLTGNTESETVDFAVVAADVATISGTLTGIPDSALKGTLGAALVPEDNSLDSVTLELTKASEGYTFAAANIVPDAKYSVVLTNADDYEVLDTVSKATGNYTDVAITATMKPLVTVTGSFVTSDKNSASVSKITFTNMDTKDYSYSFDVTGTTYTASLRAGEYETSVVCDGYEVYDHVSVADKDVANDVYLKSTATPEEATYVEMIEVGKGKTFETISEAVAYVSRMNRTENQRVTLNLTDDIYREQVIINTPNITIMGGGSGGSSTITWYYGVGCSYYSAKESTDGKNGSYYDEACAVDKYYKATVSQNPGHWGATVNLLAGATGFQAMNVIFENSFNRYLTDEELADGAGANASGGVTDRTTAGIDVQAKAAKERACVLYIQADQTEYYKCKFLSSQDTIYTGDSNEHSYFADCVIEGTTDYICGDGNPVFDMCTLSMYSYSDQEAVGSYIVANKKAATDGGYLFRNCSILSHGYSELKPTSGNILARAWAAGSVTWLNTLVESDTMLAKTAYISMNEQVADANYREYNTHLKDGTPVTTNEGITSGVTILTEEEAGKIKVTDFFGSWTSDYYTMYSNSSEYQN